ncbi:MAG: amino acid ABC transporter permease [Anaerolineae bacterium]|nr:amino acid ABC transporter permease [Anaerolineae bacterium]
MDKLPDIINSIPYLLQGALLTIAVTVLSLLTGFVIGLPLALMRVYGGKFSAKFAATYSTVMRGLPSLVVLFILFYGMAAFISLPAFVAGCIALGFCSSAYQMELLRGAIQSVGAGQMMAARALGMSRLQAIMSIILPQALRLAIPSWSNEAAVVLKDSSLIYSVGLAELLRRSQQVAARTYQSFIVYSICALIYFLLTFVTNRGLDHAERVFRLPTPLEEH